VLNKQGLVAKANEAIKSMQGQVSQGLDERRVVGVRRLWNGGILYELDTPEVAMWLRREKGTFMEGFGGSSIMKEKTMAILVEYVPTSHSPDALAENRRIEWDTGLAVEELVSTRWIKLVQRWAPGQCFSHLIAQF